MFFPQFSTVGYFALLIRMLTFSCAACDHNTYCGARALLIIIYYYSNEKVHILKENDDV